MIRLASFHTPLTLGLITLCTLCEPSTVCAQTADAAAAESLFDEGIKLMEAGSFVQACPKLVESQRLDPAVGTLLYLGECYEKNGQTASAWATFRTAADAAHAQGQSDREKIAHQRADRLQGQLSRLTISVPVDALQDGLVVRRDGVEVGRASLGVGVPVDPGKHVIEATAAGKRAWRHEVDVASQDVVVAIPVLQVQVTPASSVEQRQQEPESSDGAHPLSPAGVTRPPQADRGGGETQRTLAWIAGGVGLVGIGTGVFFGLRARSKEIDADSHCRPDDPSQCDSQGVKLLDEGRDAATISNVGFGVGGALLVTGAILYLTASPDEPTATASAWSLGPIVGQDGGGMTMRGSF